jgi:hypothetical protein
MNDKIRTLRAVLDEAARELKASPATQAKMAEMILRRAALGVSREELMEVAIEAGKIPAA